VISSLTESDGLVELADAVTAVAPGDILTFYPHTTLW
jgi:molybdopterin molybdotransferase